MSSEVFSYFMGELGYLNILGNEIIDLIYKSPHSAIIKGRVFAESLSKEIAKDEDEEDLNTLIQVERIRKLATKGIIDIDIERAFNSIRKVGNIAAHSEIEGDLEASLSIHRNIYKISCWYIETYIDYNFIAQQYKTPIQGADKNENDSNNKLEEFLGEFKELLSSSSLSKNKLPDNSDNISEDFNGKAKDIIESGVDIISDYKDKETGIENSKFSSIINLDIKDGESAYVAFSKSELKRFLPEADWTFNDTNGCITIYNNNFKSKLGEIDNTLASKVKFQIWMRRPEKEKASLQIEIAGGGIEHKPLKLALGKVLKDKLVSNEFVNVAKDAVGVVLTLNMKAIGIVDKSMDTIDNLNENSLIIKESINRFVDFIDMNIIDSWIENDVVEIVKMYINGDITIVDSIDLNEDGTNENSGGNEKMKRMITQSERMNIESIDKKVKRGNIVLNPTFQRNYVYTDDKASSVIQSILLNMPLGVVYLAEIDKQNLCVDGQQRLTSILRYLNNDFPLKKLDVLSEINGKYFKDLDEDMKDEIYDYSMEITKIKECTYEQVYFLYEKLNVGSVKLNAQEIRRCVYAGTFNSMLESVIEEDAVSYYFSTMDNTRLKGVEVLINSLAISDNPSYKSSRKKLLNDYMELHKNDDEKATEIVRNNVIKVFRLIKDVLGDRAFKFKDKDTITLTLLYPIFNSFRNIPSKDIRLNSDKIREALINVEQSDVCIFNPNGNVNGDAKGARYTMEKIEEMIVEAIGDNVDIRERIFPKEIKTLLFEKQNAMCGICNQKMLAIEDTEIDHIKPFSEGGTTEIDNAQLTHEYCNRSKGNRV